VSSPIDNSPRNEVWLVDEVEGGYYVLRIQNDRKTVFMPKSLVSAIFFQGEQ